MSDDITHFWEAYDSVRTTNDTLRQADFIQRLFLDRASEGQQRMITARRYTVNDYLQSISEHSSFWSSIRPNMSDLSAHNAQLVEGVADLKKIYPSLDESAIYYTVGTHRSPGTGVDSLVMIGSEFALGDSSQTVTHELPEHLRDYYRINPVDHLKFLTVHEYVHTQQSGMVHNLLSLALYEGIGDFIAAKATRGSSPFKAFQYGPANLDKLKKRFEQDIFKANQTFSWLWNSPNNEYGTRDLGYYMGYEIADGYYEAATDKTEAIKQIIELDYSDTSAVAAFVDQSGFFDSPLTDLEKKYDAKRPTVIRVEPSLEEVMSSISLSKITLHFSEPMDERFRNFDYGPLGEEAAIRITGVDGYSDDRTALTLTIAPLEPSKQYQLTVGSGFRNDEGYSLKPYLIDFRTK